MKNIIDKLIDKWIVDWEEELDLLEDSDDLEADETEVVYEDEPEWDLLL